MDFRIIVVFTMGIFVHCSSASPVFDSPNEDEDDPSGSSKLASMNEEINAIQADQKMPDKSGVVYNYTWVAKGRKHQEEISINKNKQTESIHVNADGESEEADVIHDFIKNRTMYCMVKRGVCFLGPLDKKATVRPNKLAKDLEKAAKKKKPASQHEVDTITNWQAYEKELLRDRSSLSKEMADLSAGIPIYKIKKNRAQDTASVLTSRGREKRYYCRYYIVTICYYRYWGRTCYIAVIRRCW